MTQPRHRLATLLIASLALATMALAQPAQAASEPAGGETTPTTPTTSTTSEATSTDNGNTSATTASVVAPATTKTTAAAESASASAAATATSTQATPASDSQPTATSPATPVATESAQAKAATAASTPAVSSRQATGTHEQYLNGGWYLTDQKGQHLGGWQRLDGGHRIVYYDPTTKRMQYGEKYIGKQWYFFRTDNGDLVYGWYTLPDGRLVYYDVDDDGQGAGMYHGAQPVGKQTYYFNRNTGVRETGLRQVDGKTYYFNPARVQNAEAHINNAWYFFHKDGTMATGFTQLPDKRVIYYNGAGQMQYGEKYLNNRWYFFDLNSGAMAIGWNTLPDGRRVFYDLDAKGNGRGMLHGIQTLGKQTYYFDDATGALHRNQVLYRSNVGQLQYFMSDGVLAVNRTSAAGKSDAQGYLILKDGENYVANQWYLYSQASRRLATGWQTIGGNRTVYYDPHTAAMVKGERFIDGYWYYFDPAAGYRHTGLTKLPDGRWIFYNGKGQMQYGQVQNGRITYYTNRATGAIEGVYNDAEVIGQNPELPTGCEITAVTMMLRYAGKDVNKIQLAYEMPRSNNGDYGFVGDPFSVTGWWIFPTGVAPVVNHHLGHSQVMTGAAFSAIVDKLIQGHLVVAWVANVNGFVNHALALTGYRDGRVYFNNPWTARKESMSLNEFYQHWNADKQRALSY